MFDPAQIGNPQPAPEQAVDIEEIAKKFLADVGAAAESDGQVSESERLLIEKCRTIIQQFLASREKEAQAALGGGPATQYISRTLGGV